MRWICFFIIAGMVSCKDSRKQEISSSDAQVVLRFNPVPGERYSYTVINESKMQQEVDDKDIDNETKLEIDVTYEFGKDTVSGYQLIIHYDKFKLYAKALEQEKELDASTAALSLDPSDKMFSAFHDASLQARVDSLGKVSSLTGAAAIRDKMKMLAGNDIEALQMLNGSIRQYISEDFFKQSVEGSLKVLTDRKLHVGDTLQSSSLVGGELNIAANAVYTLISVEGDVAKIKMKGTIDIKDQQLQVENTKVVATIKGQQTGETIMNIRTGMPESVITETTLKGSMQILGREVPFKMNIKNAIKLIGD